MKGLVLASSPTADKPQTCWFVREGLWYNLHRMSYRSVLANRAVFVLSLAGVGVSAYLMLAYMRLVTLGCSTSFDCGAVAADRHSWGLGIPALSSIPTPAFGLAAYVVLAALSFARVAAPDVRLTVAAPLLQLVLSAVGVAVSAWLTALEAFVIRHWCEWCLASAVIILLIFLASGAERLARPRAGCRSNT